MTIELANELWVAREVLSSRYHRTDGTFVPSWAGYCQEIGSSKRVVNRWLRRWFEPELPPRIELPTPAITDNP